MAWKRSNNYKERRAGKASHGKGREKTKGEEFSKRMQSSTSCQTAERFYPAETGRPNSCFTDHVFSPNILRANDSQT